MRKINEEIVRKMKFVQTCLEPMLKRLDPSILAAAYTYDPSTGGEYVCLMRNNDAVEICVSADSMAQLAVDCIKEAVLS